MYVVSIGGSDSSSGAGIQADVRVCSALGVYCMTVITAVTAQNASTITKVKPMDADTVRAQISALLENQRHVVLKISMLYSKSIIDAVVDTITHTDYDVMNVVIDPVLRAGSGRYLLKRDARSYYMEKLLHLATIVTPNIIEAEWLSSMRIRGYDDVRKASVKIASLGAKSVVIKGGHIHREDNKDKGNDDNDNDNDNDNYDNEEDEYVTDLLYHKGIFYTFTNRRIKGSRIHGAGSIFSAAIAAELAKGNDLISAVRIANNFTHTAIVNTSIDGSTKIPLIGNEYVDANDDVIASLRRAIDILQFTVDGIALLIPESQSNLVFARAGAESRDDVAGVVGRIVRYEHGYARAAGPIRYGASKHVADAVLTAMKYDSSMRSAMNIRYDDAIIDICKRLGLSIAEYDRSREPENIKKREGMSVRWGIEQAIISSISGTSLPTQSRVPDVVYHRGDWGKEPMVIVFGKNPMDLLNKVHSILAMYKDYTGVEEAKRLGGG
ncbi:MAG: bifunctional hydroxymethylpyrimidine kinase/phosphomethylpyrimidine kinase [Candidatus Nitrosocaldus sp.]